MKKAFITCATAIIFAMSFMSTASAGYGHGHGHGHSHGHSSKKHHAKKRNRKRGKQRMSICRLQMDGSYKLKSLPLRAALRQLARNEDNKEPFVDADGNESCNEIVVPRDTTCKVTLASETVSLSTGETLPAGTELTVEDYIAFRTDIESYVFRTDRDSCDISHSTGPVLGVSLGNETFGTADISFFGLSPRPVLEITTDEVYNDCAFDLESVTGGMDGTCPPLVPVP